MHCKSYVFHLLRHMAPVNNRIIPKLNATQSTSADKLYVLLIPLRVLDIQHKLTITGGWCEKFDNAVHYVGQKNEQFCSKYQYPGRVKLCLLLYLCYRFSSCTISIIMYVDRKSIFACHHLIMNSNMQLARQCLFWITTLNSQSYQSLLASYSGSGLVKHSQQYYVRIAVS